MEFILEYARWHMSTQTHQLFSDFERYVFVHVHKYSMESKASRKTCVFFPHKYLMLLPY